MITIILLSSIPLLYNYAQKCTPMCTFILELTMMVPAVLCCGNCNGFEYFCELTN